MTLPNNPGYTGKTKTGSKKSQPKPHKNPLDTKKTQEKGVKNTKKPESKELKKDNQVSKQSEPRTTESKLQWRQVTKKSQRSFSKNKESAYLETKQMDEAPKKKAYTPKSVSTKPSTGFVKASGGWDKKKPVKVITRTWDIPGEKIVDGKKVNAEKIDTKKSKKTDAPSTNKIKPQFPIPSWEKEIKKVNKKELIDPTML